MASPQLTIGQTDVVAVNSKATPSFQINLGQVSLSNGEISQDETSGCAIVGTRLTAHPSQRDVDTLSPAPPWFYPRKAAIKDPGCWTARHFEKWLPSTSRLNGPDVFGPFCFQWVTLYSRWWRFLVRMNLKENVSFHSSVWNFVFANK